MTPPRAPFERLTRWYPAWWRQANGEDFVTTAMHVAESSGAAAPSGAERRAAALSGLGTRFDTRTARIAIVAAFVLSALLTAVSQFAGSRFALSMWTVTLVVQAGLVPLLWWITALCLARRRLYTDPVRTLVAASFAVVSCGAAAAAFLSWSVGFDEADAGVTRSLFSMLWLPLTLLGAVCAGLGVAVLVADRLPRGRFAPLLAILLGLGAAVTAPMGALTLVNPFSTLLVSGAGLIVVALTAPEGTPRASAKVAPPAGSATPRRHLAPPHPVASRALALLAAAGSLAGVTFALTGHLYTPLNGTEAVIAGLRASTAFGILIVVALALRSRQRWSTWGPATLLSLTLALVVSGWGTLVPSGNPRPVDPVVWLLAAGAVAWLVLAARWRNRMLTATVCIVAAVSLPLFGPMLAAVTGVIVPIIAVVVALLPRAPRTAAFASSVLTQ